jgi:UDP-N-acetylglucosamine/UDP-N-acetylgalactosamine diphosphorylase
VFEEAKRFALFETLREEEFAPLKNATGSDSPDSARKMLRELHRKWAENEGITLEGEGDVEIDPLVSYNGEGLKDWVLQKHGSLHVKLPLYIQ